MNAPGVLLIFGFNLESKKGNILFAVRNQSGEWSWFVLCARRYITTDYNVMLFFLKNY